MTEELWIKRWNELNRQFSELTKEQADLQGAYNIAMKEINRLRKLLGYDK